MTDLLFVGDTAWPEPGCLDVEGLRDQLESCRLVLNLEGPLISGNPTQARTLNDFKFNLYSDRSFLRVAEALQVVGCGLANNHITDYFGGVENTGILLKSAGIQSFGLRGQPTVSLSLDGQRVVVLGVCWNLPEPIDRPGANWPNVVHPAMALRQVQNLRESDDKAIIVVFIHWGYELALYPEPADRQWARRAVECGANFVIGHHPHVVQGVERHRNGLIAHSIGNFLLPQVRYRDKTLTFAPEQTSEQLGLRISSFGCELYWFHYDKLAGAVRLHRTGCEIESDENNACKTPFVDMNDEQYLGWFLAEGRKGVLTKRRSGPVFTSYSGVSRINSSAKLSFMKAKRRLRKVLIRAGVHRPYNW